MRRTAAKFIFKLVGTIVATVALGGLLLLLFHRASPPFLPPLPNPNGYEDLLQAAAMATKGPTDHEVTDREELRDLVKKNREALERVRLGLSRECRVPLEYSREYRSKHFSTDLMPLRRLQAALTQEGRLADMEGNGEALWSYLNIISLGEELSRGGLVIDHLFAWSVEELGLLELRRLEPTFTDARGKEVASALERVLERKEPFEEVLARERAFQRLYRLDERIKEEALCLWCFHETVEMSRHETLVWLKHSEARKALLLADIAIHLHKQTKGRLPLTLTELVPGYLHSVPLDPFTGSPLIYELTPDGYSLAIAGPKGKKDGGISPVWPAFAGN